MMRLAIVLAAVMSGGIGCPAVAGQESPLPALLQEILSHARPATDLRVHYTDMSGLYGGDVFALDGSGTLVHTFRDRRGQGGQTSHPVSPDGQEQVVRLLLAIKAWEQRVPDAPMVPDESRAYLQIDVGSASSNIWERYSDLDTGNRIRQVSDLLRSFTRSR
ncbi:MAG: hypothetical protein GX442_10900 [Candidatus Riflebacteria bacterium]|nr:hypothetical protein [Candidatus Riflebacteria bacterium]